jgi:amino acid transporter
LASAFSLLKRTLIGRPLATEQEIHQRLPKKIALAVFSSDAISSTAYATEEILIALVLAGSLMATRYVLPVAAAVAFLLVIVALSYEQTVHAYPSGGGSYIVASDNLGRYPGLVAAASLLTDYVMTVAVSVASGVAAIIAAFPELLPYRVALAVVVVALIAAANLRGLRESGRLFAVPTYAFILLCGGAIVVGVIRWMTGSLHPIPIENLPGTQELTIFLILRAFAGGCSAMTGTEAISNGVPAFKPPESRNAGITLGVMAGTLAFLFLGISLLTSVLHVLPVETDTVLSQVGRAVYGKGTFLYYALQVTTMAILFVGANTSFADFPRLSSILARDGFAPRQFMNRGDRLVFSNGIIGLAAAAIVILLIFGAQVHKLIPLYAVGVFLSFTLSQSGMVRHWFRLKTGAWRSKALMNGFGAFMTGIVSVVIVVTKFPHGAYIIVAAIPLLVLIFAGIRRHYDRVGAALGTREKMEIQLLRYLAEAPPRTTVVLLVAQVNWLTARALSFARSLGAADIHAVTVRIDEARLKRLETDWAELDTGVELEALDSPYRELIRPVVAFVRSLDPGPEHLVTVVIPEFVVEKWWQAALHNQDALRLKAALLLVPWVAVISIPYRMRRGGHDPGREISEAVGAGGGRETMDG